MKIILVSRDRELEKLCRSVLDQLSVEELVLETPGSRHGAADLTIWDLSSGKAPHGLADDSSDLFVVSRKALPDIQKLLPVCTFGLLLKPVKRPVLHAFLSTALRSWGNHPEDHQARLRLDSRDQLLQALLEANVRLQECDQDRTNFLARALHDFRTPLTALQGYCDMLIRERAGPLDTYQIDLLQRMQHSIGRLSRMSRAMFDLSIHHNTEAKPSLLKTNIDNCIQNAVHQIIPIAQDKGIVLSVDLNPPDTHLYIDPGAIEQVFINLLENACKFTPRGGAVEIRGRVSATDGQSKSPKNLQAEQRCALVYKVEIQDSGMGILPQHLESVFEEFTSYAGARDRSGGGLGLAICKMLVTAHKGAIWAESDQGGTTISLTLPMRHEVILGQPSTVVGRALATGASI
jgi:signal transduction histidine kinase